ncbi:glycosyltransferase [Klebsiella pasteurii]|uniref:Glycosyltransferase n=1 Tax=Klebsiella pasteurii TaxID=2587529 RepID=A0ABD5HKR2_9ENTR|nr:glycosyltransferase [Klebsiella pasteurii]MDW2719216.1 glycosyltransferase [Klebsiella pasteurii]
MTKRKIAIYNLNTYPEMSGGSERSCLELAKELITLGEDVRVVTLNPFKDGFNKLRYDNVDIYKLPLLNVYWPTDKRKKSLIKKIIWNAIDIANLPMCIILSVFLRKQGVNIVHTNNIKGASPLAFPIFKLFGFKVVHTTRDYYLLDDESWYRDIRSNHNTTKLKAKRCAKNIFSKSVDCVVYNSEYMMEYHKACGFFKNTSNKVIYNGFDPKIYMRSELRKNPKKIKVFGFIGRVTKEKGLDLLIDGFLKFKNGDYKLIIAGATLDDFLDIYPEFENAIKDRTDISFIGFTENIEFYNQVDCVVVPSRYNEPFGRVAMESIFMGKSVIVSERGGLPEQIIPGVIGTVCKDNDFHTSMQNVIQLSNDKFSASDTHIDLNKFTIRYSAHAYLDVYKEVLNEL